MQRRGVGQPVRIDIHAPQFQSLSCPVIQFAVQAGQDLLPRLADRALGQRNKVEVTDTRDVVPGGQGTGYQQVGNPAQVGETIRSHADGRRDTGHPASLVLPARRPAARAVLHGRHSAT